MTATHNGTCQICGQLAAVNQKHSNLAKHGYTVRFNFFEGVCSGAEELPFELSCGLIEKFVAQQQARADQMTADIATLRSDFSGDSAFVSIYHPAKWGAGRTKIAARTEWRRVQLVQGAHSWSFHYVNDKGVTELKATNHYTVTPIADVIRELNASYAWHLDQTLNQIKLYIQWQQARIASWKPAELKPRVADAPKKMTTRTRGARVNVWMGSGKPAKQGEVLGSSNLCGFAHVTVKFDDGTTKTVRQAWCSLVKTEAA